MMKTDPLHKKWRGMAVDQETNAKPLRKEFRGHQPWKAKVQKLNRAAIHANTKGGKQYLEAFIEGQLQSGPVKRQFTPEEIAEMEEMYKR